MRIYEIYIGLYIVAIKGKHPPPDDGAHVRASIRLVNKIRLKKWRNSASPCSGYFSVLEKSPEIFLQNKCSLGSNFIYIWQHSIVIAQIQEKTNILLTIFNHFIFLNVTRRISLYPWRKSKKRINFLTRLEAKQASFSFFWLNRKTCLQKRLLTSRSNS